MPAKGTIPREVKLALVKFRLLNGATQAECVRDLKTTLPLVQGVRKGLKIHDKNSIKQSFDEIRMLESVHGKSYLTVDMALPNVESIKGKLVIVANTLCDNVMENAKELKKLNIVQQVKMLKDVITSVKALTNPKEYESKTEQINLTDLIQNLENKDIKVSTRIMAKEVIIDGTN